VAGLAQKHDACTPEPVERRPERGIVERRQRLDGGADHVGDGLGPCVAGGMIAGRTGAILDPSLLPD
jgi:hypothetical protein